MIEEVRKETQQLLQRDKFKMVKADEGPKGEMCSVGGLAWLDARAASWTTHGKLDPRWLGPYKVLEKIGEVSFRLRLPAFVRAHNVFHASKLKPCKDIVEEELAEDEYEVEDIIGAERSRGRWHYLVKWKDFPLKESWWLREQELTCDEILADFKDRHKERLGKGLPVRPPSGAPRRRR